MGTDLKLSEDAGDRTLFVMIPGNPGNEGYYAEFGRLLLEKFGDPNALFYTVSHLNHVPLPVELQIAKSPSGYERFRLEEQVEHKLQFCREILPKSKRVLFFGHSIGSYMMLKIVPQLLDDGVPISRAFALFPTVERMAGSPNGRRLFGLLRFFDRNDWMTRIVAGVLEYLPATFKSFLCRFHLSSSPECIVSSASELGYSTVIRNIIHMSNDELENVCEFNEELLKAGKKIQDYGKYAETRSGGPSDHRRTWMRARLRYPGQRNYGRRTREDAKPVIYLNYNTEYNLGTYEVEE
ncbi:hypothetical protein L596_014801 [Steinernema carpocapsae]|uniref:Lipid droplet-associated hydrolase n=1 Tax=Steinernema carpocapsae TaxID=34508 RepID=A0A4U5NDX3_STECR|nr:hypothetical protein L596_014801 [Steinernema carpocapsae]